MEKILVINGGSSSFKYQVIEKGTERRLCQGLVEKIGAADSMLTHKRFNENGETEKFPYPGNYATHADGMAKVAEVLLNRELGGVIDDKSEIVVIGHRVLMGGPDYQEALVDETVKQVIRDYIPLGPLHNPANLTGIEAMEKIFPGVPNVAVFDTGFHATMPDYAYTYALPKELCAKYHLRRYGFHGTSHRFVSKAAAALLGKKPSEVNVIVAHLGNGSSLSAVRAGKCVDTSMGTTPLQGVVMGTRCGDIDPALVPFLMKNEGLTTDQMDALMNKKSGYLGLCGHSDCREIEAGMAAGDADCKLTYEVQCYSVRKYVGAFMAALGHTVIIAFAGGIRENAAGVRAKILENLEEFGIEIDPELNKIRSGEPHFISKPGSRVKVAVIPTDEELEISRISLEIVGK
ncbi:MAG: acetate kinase [Mailhella sp.]|nr:acetate kinase [Mailhella sp.]